MLKRVFLSKFYKLDFVKKINDKKYLTFIKNYLQTKDGVYSPFNEISKKDVNIFIYNQIKNNKEIRLIPIGFNLASNFVIFKFLKYNKNFEFIGNLEKKFEIKEDEYSLVLIKNMLSFIYYEKEIIKNENFDNEDEDITSIKILKEYYDTQEEKYSILFENEKERLEKIRNGGKND